MILAPPGFAMIRITPKWTISLRSWCKTVKTVRSRNVAVGRAKKSIDARAFEWLSRRRVQPVVATLWHRRLL